MPRRPRCIVPHIPHHVVQRGNNRQNIFYDDYDREFLKKQLHGYAIMNDIEISAYCFMSNHIHLLVYPEKEDGLKTFMKMVGQVYSQYVNRRHKRTGKLFDNRYKLHIVDPDADILVARYIDLNPVRVGMVRRAEEYMYSSARCHVGMGFDKIISRDIIKGEYEGYKRYLTEGLGEDVVMCIRTTVQQEKVLGNEFFIEKIESMFGRVLHIRPQGRPRIKKGVCDDPFFPRPLFSSFSHGDPFSHTIKH